MVRALLAVWLCAGCADRCKQVDAARAALTSRTGRANRGPDIEVVIPLVRANALIAELLHQQPLTVPLEVRLGIDVSPLTATIERLVVEPGRPGTLQFTAQVAIADAEHVVTILTATAEVHPVVSHTELTIALGPENILALRPELGPDATATLGSAVARWLPARLHGALPQPVVDAAAAQLGSHLTSVTWSMLQRTLLTRLGELTTLRLALPDVPVAHVEIYAPDGLLVVDLVSDLPIRAGLAPLATPPSQIIVRIARSAAAELANWTIDHAYAPRWYERGLSPSPGGEFRPRFDFEPGTSHPFKVYSFQERGGCSYLKIGIEASIAIASERLVVTVTDQELEGVAANPLIEAGAWAKFFITGAIDESRQVATHFELHIGRRTLATSVTSAALARDELMFGLRFSAPRSFGAIDPTPAREPHNRSTCSSCSIAAVRANRDAAG